MSCTAYSNYAATYLPELPRLGKKLPRLGDLPPKVSIQLSGAGHFVFTSSQIRYARGAYPRRDIVRGETFFASGKRPVTTHGTYAGWRPGDDRATCANRPSA